MKFFPIFSHFSIISYMVFLTVLPNIASTQEIIRKDDIREPEVVIPEIDKISIPHFPNTEDEEKIILTPQYLQKHPEELENLLVNLLQQGNSEGLQLLLPIYVEVTNRDESLIEWGNAIILAQEGKFNESVALYRKLISHFPDVSVIRFQLAMALFYDKQFVASKNEFEKLRAEVGEDTGAINEYLTAIDQQNSWNFSGGLSYVQNDNINNVIGEGVKVTYPNGETLISKQERESARGFDFSFSADKRFSLQNNFYLKLEGNSNGSIYWDNKKYNVFSIRIMPGIGYSNAYTDISISPFIRNQWYAGGGKRETSDLKSFIMTTGARLNIQQWLSPQWRYQGALELSRDKYTVNYNHLDGNNYSLSNTITYVPNQENYFYGGIDFNRKSARSESNSYNRLGARIGWGHEWNHGISTSLSAGYGKRSYEGVDFVNIKQKNNEYNMNISIWNRGFHIWDITPRLVWTYSKTDSNQPLYSFDNNKIYLDFSKTF